MQGTGTAADRALMKGRDVICVSGDDYAAMICRASAATSVGEDELHVLVCDRAFSGMVVGCDDVRPFAAARCMGMFIDDSWDREPRVTETPKRPRVWLPVIQTEAKPLRDRKRLLARRRK